MNEIILKKTKEPGGWMCHTPGDKPKFGATPQQALAAYLTPEKENPITKTKFAFGVVPDTHKTVEEVNYETRNYDGIRWIRFDHYVHAIITQNQAADERLREVFAAILEEQTTFDNYNNTQTYAGVLVADIRRIAKEHGITNL